jgi:hypothetical protein
MRNRYQLGVMQVVLTLSLISGAANADALIVVCYNWGCLARQPVSYPEPWLRKATQPLRQAKTPEAERIAAAEVVHRFYLKAAEQTPIGADAPGNDEDPSVNGRMDCIDHSATTKNMLLYLQHRKWLRWHDVGSYAHRSLLVGSHYSATLIEKGSADDAGIFVIDPWGVDPATLPELAPVREWAGPRFYSLEMQHHTQNPPAALTR